ncbi:nuclease [Microbacterium sp. NPDC096154]|uniref:nuclease n=1 Tax=Microbacterium sp. NPDC096154 TaxID=3155549 RepID=UPI00331D5617
MSNRATQEVLPVQRAVASAWPSAWIDALVMCSDASGIALATLAGDDLAVDAIVSLAPGEPVAFHPVAEVLAVGGTLVRARRR